jgi:hypothetical protein
MHPLVAVNERSFLTSTCTIGPSLHFATLRYTSLTETVAHKSSCAKLHSFGNVMITIVSPLPKPSVSTQIRSTATEEPCYFADVRALTDMLLPSQAKRTGSNHSHFVPNGCLNPNGRTTLIDDQHCHRRKGAADSSANHNGPKWQQ